eukprot:366357-Pyramimonas_sp.AAC.1
MPRTCTQRGRASRGGARPGAQWVTARPVKAQRGCPARQVRSGAGAGPCRQHPRNSSRERPSRG